jgi:hypothetical protein
MSDALGSKYGARYRDIRRLVKALDWPFVAESKCDNLPAYLVYAVAAPVLVVLWYRPVSLAAAPSPSSYGTVLLSEVEIPLGLSERSEWVGCKTIS